MRKVYGVYKEYCDEDPVLIELFGNELRATKYAEEAYKKDLTRIQCMKDVEKGIAKIERNYGESIFHYYGLFKYTIRIKYFVKEMRVS